MESGTSTAFLALILAVALASLLIVRLTLFLKDFQGEVHYIRMEMYRAGDDAGYRYWRKKLRCCYLCLLPFVTERNVERVYAAIFHKPQHGRSGRRGDGLWSLLAPSLIGMGLCAVSLCGMSWAWFAASISSSTQPIRTPTYTLETTVRAGGAAVTGRTVENGTAYSLSAGQTYTVELLATGTGGATGYCEITAAGTAYCTAPIVAEGTLRFRVRLKDDGDITVTPKWGTRAQQPVDPIVNNGFIGAADSDVAEAPANPAPDSASEEPEKSGPDDVADDIRESVPEETVAGTPDASAAAEAEDDWQQEQ